MALLAAPLAPRRVAVLGAGAVGGYYGALLARAGIDVTLIGREPHVAAIARDGIVVLRASGDLKVPVGATTTPAAAGTADVVLVCVKSQDTAAAGRELLPHLRRDARLLCMQNGVDNAARLAAVVPHPVYTAAVYVGATMDGPGRVRHTGRGDLVLGVPRALAGRGDSAGDLAALAAMFEGAGIACPVSPDIEATLWTKLVINCAFNAVSALGQSRYGRMAASAPSRGVMAEAAREAVAVARADGVQLDPDQLVDAVWQVADALAGQYSSTAQDVQRGRRTEIDALNGYVVERGAALGVPTPVNRTLHALVRLREDAPTDDRG